MFDVRKTDYSPIEDYTFGWRWTDQNRVDVPLAELSRIKPLTQEKAREAWDYSAAFQGKAYRTRFREIDEFHINGRGEPDRDDVVQDWLEKRLPPEGERVFISWTERMAVETDRETFIKHWDTFCYPVEDVVIWPQTEHWVLLFDYKQRFYFAVKESQNSGGLKSSKPDSPS